ncbi:protein translocase subunit SecF [Anaerosolibacter sp.]|uniref:protein translocase subunit SecF n=1 Tax=Anaerosolibacter sp. TaxID=1872527 RepID=UPI0039EF161C
MRIVEKSKIWFGLSIAVIVIGLFVGLINGFNMGIDFTGGTMMQINIGETIGVEEAKDITSQFALDADILHAGEEKQEIIIKTKKDLDNKEREEIFNVFKEKYNLQDEDFRQAEQFGPTMGKEIAQKALLSIAIASIGMLAYITFRFEFKFGVAGIIALIHDVLVVVAIYGLFQIPLNSSLVAAVLTVVGYSINDTIVVFDRIRENLKFAKKPDYAGIANESINQTLARSINTSLTTLITIVTLYVLGVESIRQFALPLIAGIATGAYSSIFIASPIWVIWKNWEKGKGKYRPV